MGQCYRMNDQLVTDQKRFKVVELCDRRRKQRNVLEECIGLQQTVMDDSTEERLGSYTMMDKVRVQIGLRTRCFRLVIILIDTR